jgi:hypothetical protein
MNKYTKTARNSLEQYFAAAKEIEAQKASGALDNLHYVLKLNDLKDKLNENNYVAYICLKSAESFGPRNFQDGSDRDYLEQLSQHEWEKTRAWAQEWTATNLQNIALGIVSIVENMTFPDLPKADPDKIRSRMRAAHYHEDTIQATLDSFLGHLKKD